MTTASPGPSGQIWNAVKRVGAVGLIAGTLSAWAGLLGYMVAAAVSAANPGSTSLLIRWMAALASGADLARIILFWGGWQVLSGPAWAVLFAFWFAPGVKGAVWAQGMRFSLIPWAATNAFFLPAIGLGFFGWNLGPLPAFGSLAVSLLFGALVGLGSKQAGVVEESFPEPDDAPADALAPARSTERTSALLMGWSLLAIVVMGVLFTLAAKQQWWMPPVASQHGGEIDRLFTVTLVITGVVFILVQATLGFFVMRFSERNVVSAIHWPEHHSLELTWILVPAAALTVLTLMGGLVWTRVHAAPPADAMTVEVTGEQFAWRIRYPGKDGVFGRTDPRRIAADNPLGLAPDDQAGKDDIVLAAELRLPEGRPVRVRLRAKDVLHSFFLPNHRVKQDAVPGRVIEIWFVPTRAGDYSIACAELCGVGHYIMRGAVKVLPPAEFDSWLASQGRR
ncbi:MAG: cytochrome c oxidase subunit II [Armatimonadetes bacterium]|nr:cytochrome c oxidase subunit II [Armatimonadota bacterium]